MKSLNLTDCESCRYVQEERAAIHQYDGRAPRWLAEQLSKSEKCYDHREPEQTPWLIAALQAIE
jgi:hypothetical protein